MKHTLKPKRWHGQAPISSEQAHTRLLDAAMNCFERIGVLRTTIEDIAAEAGVHRTTVYEYFKSRDEVLMHAFEREAEEIIANTQHNFPNKSFIRGLVTAISEGAQLAKKSPHHAFLLEFAHSHLFRVDATGESIDSWKAFVFSRLAKPMAAAVKRGEVRSDVPVTELVTWVLRIAMSVTTDPPDDVERALNLFLVPALSAAPKK